MDKFWDILIKLPTDYTDYGGEIQRWADPDMDYPDCSSGCRHWQAIDADWGICTKLNSPRAGMLTFEHQAGYSCFE